MRTIYHRKHQPLDAFFSPQSVALIGATERPGSVGRTLLENLTRSSFGGAVYPVNPGRDSVLGIKAHKQIADIPGPVDLAVIATPAPTVPAIVEQCAVAGVKCALIISAGFSEIGADGLALEKRILDVLRTSHMRLIGPNCLGVMNPSSGLNATFAGGSVEPGSVALVSQSGALLTAILDWSRKERMGFSKFISIGSMLDVGWGDLIDYLADDPHTRSIVMYMESVDDARSFVSAAREAATRKPIIVLKSGRTSQAAKAAASHTGAMAASDAVIDAAFLRCGVLRVRSIEDLFNMAELMASQPLALGPRLMIVTNAGGLGVLATDSLISSGGSLACLTDESLELLDQILPEHWSHANPIDILGDADPDRYGKAVEIAVKDPHCDGVLAILSPQAMTNPTRSAERIAVAAKMAGKPMIASWMGGPSVEAGRAILQQAGYAEFSYPDAAARAFHYLWRYSYNLKGLYETPEPLPLNEEGLDRLAAASIIEDARAARRTILDEVDSKRILAAYGIPTVETVVALDADAAAVAATHLGYPVVVKLFSHSITHKTDVGGVRLNLADEQAVRGAFVSIRESVSQKAGAEHFGGVTVQPMIRTTGEEVIVGCAADAQFGPVLLFGAGGQLAEIINDRAIGFPPLNRTLARRMMERTRIWDVMKGVRGRKPVDQARLEGILVQLSALVTDHPRIKEIDVNPLLVSAESISALDARIILHDADVSDQCLPKPIIRPYPSQYVSECPLKDGTVVRIRPIRPEDEPCMVEFHERLSDISVYNRYFQSIKLAQRTAHERLSRLCFIDYDREMALVAEMPTLSGQPPTIVGVGRLIKAHSGREAEFALLVTDAFQGRGLGTALLRRLIDVAHDERIQRLTATIVAENQRMKHLCERQGFHIEYQGADREMSAWLDLVTQDDG